MWTSTWRLFTLLTLITGVFYPLAITGLAQILFPWQANGSLVVKQNQTVGSQWIGQSFTSDDYFWGRPSSTKNNAYNGMSSGGSNLATSNPVLINDIRAKITERRLFDLPIPVDLVTASASGLDPDISPNAAYYQMTRVAKARHISVTQVQNLIQTHTQDRSFSLLGEPRVNVLRLNMALDDLSK